MVAKVREQATQKQLKHVGVAECNKTIAAPLQNKYQSVVFVQNSLGYGGGNSTTLIGAGLDQEYAPPFTDYLTDYLTDCWAGVAEVDCQLFLNSDLLVGVIVANIFKCSVMIFMVLKFTKPSLVTRGDAIASFLEDEDPTTIGLRNTERRRFHRETWVFQETVTFAGTQKRWGSALSRSKWGFSILM